MFLSEGQLAQIQWAERHVRSYARVQRPGSIAAQGLDDIADVLALVAQQVLQSEQDAAERPPWERIGCTQESV